MRDVFLEIVVVVEQIMDEAHAIVAVDDFGQRTLTQVEVGQQGLLAGIGQRQGQVDGCVRLAFARHGRYRLDDLLTLLEEERDVRVQQTEGFRDHIVTRGGDDDFVVLASLGLQRYLSQYGQRRHLLHIVLGTKLGVEERDKEHDHCRDGQTEDDGHHCKHHQTWAGELGDGRLHHLGISHGDGQVHGRLFAFAEEVEVEFILDLLLTHHLGDGLGLGGHGRYLAAGAALLATGLLQAHTRSVQQVVDRRGDGGPLGVHAGGQVLHLRVVFTAGHLHTRQLVDQHVVLRNHLLRAGIADSHVGRNDFHLVARVGDIVLDEFDEAILGFEFHHLLGIADAHLLQRAGRRLQIGYTRLLLNAFHLGIHVAQLATNQRDALGYEAFGLLSHLVLVLDGIVVVDGDECVHYLVGTHRVAVLELDGEDGSLLVHAGHRQAAEHAAGHREHLGQADIELDALEARVEELRRLHHERHRVVHFDHLVEIGFALDRATIPHSGVAVLVVGLHLDAQSDMRLALFVQVRDADAQRRIAEVADLAKSVVAVAVVLHVQAVHHLGHQRR